MNKKQESRRGRKTRRLEKYLNKNIDIEIEKKKYWRHHLTIAFSLDRTDGNLKDISLSNKDFHVRLVTFFAS